MHRYMIHPISFRMQLSPEHHSSEWLFSSSCLTPAPVWLCVFLSWWCSSFVGRGYRSLCKSQNSPGKLYTWPRRCCFHLKLVQHFYIMWSTIKFRISNFAIEKKWSTTFLYSSQQKSFGDRAVPMQQAEAVRFTTLSCLTWVYQLSYTVMFTMCMCVCMPTHFYHG